MATGAARPILQTSPSRSARIAEGTPEQRLLDIRGLKTHFKTDDGWLHAVDGVDLGVDRGQTVSVVGESGCGKDATSSPRAARRCGASAPRRSRSSSRSR